MWILIFLFISEMKVAEINQIENYLGKLSTLKAQVQKTLFNNNIDQIGRYFLRDEAYGKDYLILNYTWIHIVQGLVTKRDLLLNLTMFGRNCLDFRMKIQLLFISN